MTARPVRRSPLAPALLVLALAVLPGCSWFQGVDETEEAPAQLVDFESSLKIREAWNAGVGSGNEILRLALTPATDGTRIFAADNDGRIVAFDALKGKRAWRADTELPLAGGPAV